jgi:hypothetical protein
MKMPGKKTIQAFATLPAAVTALLLGLSPARGAYPDVILGDNAVCFLRLNDSPGATLAADSSASGAYPGVYVYSSDNRYPVLQQPGLDSNSITLSVSDPSSVSIGYDDALNQAAPFSFEIWARPVSTDTANYRCPVGNFSGWGTAVQSGWYIYQTPGTPSSFVFVTPGGNWIQSAPITLLDWYHLAVAYDGTNFSFYLNGVLVGSQSGAGIFVANAVNNAGVNPISLGSRGDSSGYGAFDGGLDDFAYYTNTLSLAQIQNHYQVGTNSFVAGAQPPYILTQPNPATNYAGQSVTFSVLADGTAPLSYQWYKATARLAGATNAALNFVCAPADNGAAYQVVVGNSVGSVTSSIVTLTVSTNLLIDAPLTSIIREVGSSAAFEVVAEGPAPMTFQWKNGDGSIIPGATNPILWLSKLQAGQDGSTYYVSIVTPYASIDSAPATLNVQARSVTVPLTGYAQVVAADHPVAYWRLNESSGAAVATDAVGSFDGAYNPGSGTINYGVATGIPHESDTGIAIAGGATVNIPYAIELNSPKAFSVEGWFNAASLAANSGDYRTPISSMSNPYGEGPTGWLVYQTAGNNWAWWVYHGYWANAQFTDNDAVAPGQWYHLAMTYDGVNFTFYVNGVAKASGPDAAFVQNGTVPPGGAAFYNYNYNTGVGLPTGSGAMVLGWRSDSGFNPFQGDIDDVAVYNTALSAQQVQNHYLNTTHMSAVISGHNLVVTWGAGTLQSAASPAGPYSNVGVNVTSPYTNTVSSAPLFFRAKLQ